MIWQTASAKNYNFMIVCISFYALKISIILLYWLNLSEPLNPWSIGTRGTPNCFSTSYSMPMYYYIFEYYKNTNQSKVLFHLKARMRAKNAISVTKTQITRLAIGLFWCYSAYIQKQLLLSNVHLPLWHEQQWFQYSDLFYLVNCPAGLQHPVTICILCSECELN